MTAPTCSPEVTTHGGDVKKLAEQVLAADERRQARDCTAGEHAHLIDALTDAAPALAREMIRLHAAVTPDAALANAREAIRKYAERFADGTPEALVLRQVTQWDVFEVPTHAGVTPEDREAVGWLLEQADYNARRATLQAEGLEAASPYWSSVESYRRTESLDCTDFIMTSSAHDGRNVPTS